MFPPRKSKPKRKTSFEDLRSFEWCVGWDHETPSLAFSPPWWCSPCRFPGYRKSSDHYETLTQSVEVRKCQEHQEQSTAGTQKQLERVKDSIQWLYGAYTAPIWPCTKSRNLHTVMCLSLLIWAPIMMFRRSVRRIGDKTYISQVTRDFEIPLCCNAPGIARVEQVLYRKLSSLKKGVIRRNSTNTPQKLMT